MRDWKSLIRERLAPLRLKPGAEADFVEELAQHLEDRYRESLSGGAEEDEAFQSAIAELEDMYPLAEGIERNERMPKYDVCAAGRWGSGELHGGFLARSSVRGPYDAEQSHLCSVCGIDAGLWESVRTRPSSR